MFFKSSSIEDRHTLISTLEKDGFIVHGIITPSDILWSYLSKIEADLFNTIYRETVEKFTLPFASDEFPPYFQEVCENFPSLKKIITDFTNNKPDYTAKPGSSFLAAEMTGSSKYLENMSFLAKVIIEQLPGYDKYKDPKGFMLELFLHHCGELFKHIVIADDKVSVIEAVGKVECHLPLTTIHVTSESIPVKDYKKYLKDIPSKKSKSRLNLSKISSLSLFSKKSKSSSTVEIIDKKEQQDSQDDKIETDSDLAVTDYDGDISSSDDSSEDKPQQKFPEIGSHRSIAYTL